MALTRGRFFRAEPHADATAAVFMVSASLRGAAITARKPQPLPRQALVTTTDEWIESLEI
jgi:hypothetical protein